MEEDDVRTAPDEEKLVPSTTSSRNPVGPAGRCREPMSSHLRRSRVISRLSKRSVSRTRSQSPIRRAPLPLRLDDVDGNGNRDSQDESGPSFGSIFGSARLALDPPAPAIAFNFSLPFDQNPSTINPASLSSNTDTAPNSSLKTSLPWLPTPPEPQALQPAPVPKPPAELILSNDPHVPFPQISSFATWEQVGFFLSLHMLHQHVLTPLVHQPSFARDLLHRRDVNDEAFRGLLMSIGEL